MAPLLPSRIKSFADEDDCERLLDEAITPETVFSGRRNGLPTANIWRVYVFVLHILAITSLGILWVSSPPRTFALATRGRTWSPAQKYVEYEVADRPAMEHGAYSKYSGPPTTEQDAAWDALIRPVYFNATLQEIEKAGESQTNLTELVGGGYPATLGVYHELHCLRQLRFYLFQDYYYPNLTQTELQYVQGHLGML
ncbi:hypothetical protein NQ176_g8643 [Zarea fungicola]|uniref:Uncharacterized protein n=1 Tax=Zarea fungicola TaxID=93591 RepID=A0ACC1MSI7_9HYPO|nr:hypothetical protein NQ176_g8643 [Lecanicillium fungicola]